MAGSAAFAADPPPANDDYDRALLGDPARPDAKGPADESMEKKLQHELGSAARREDQLQPGDKPKDPLLRIAEEMRDVAPRLGNRDSGKVTQYLQQQIVADLDKVIEEAKKSEPKNNRLSPVGKAQGGGPKRPNPKKQVEAPRAPVAPSKTDPPIGKSDKDREQELAEARERMKKLFRANLPSHPREHVLEEPSEYFLPEYQLEIEDYFRRLSEDRSDAGTR